MIKFFGIPRVFSNRNICILQRKYEELVLKILKDQEIFKEYSNDVNDVYRSIGKYNPEKKREVLRAFDDIITDLISNKKRHLVVTKLLLKVGK